jgi:hypothetical protein
MFDFGYCYKIFIEKNVNLMNINFISNEDC